MSPDESTASATLGPALRAPALPAVLPEVSRAPDEPAPVQVEILTDEAAAAVLADPAFGRAWDGLYEVCPWRTVFQQRAFAEAWFTTYAGRYAPVVAVAYEPDGRMAGLLVLALERDGGRLRRDRLHVAGAHQCEYQTWLALPRHGDGFIAAALDALRRAFPAANLDFLYLAPGSPTAWCAEGTLWGRRTLVEQVPRALRDIGSDAAEASLRKKSNKSRLKQLGRIGEVRFERIENPAAFRRMLDDFVPVHDARQGAANGVLPFTDDPLKAPFHERLFAIPGFLYVTALRAGDTFVAGQIAVRDGGSLALGPHSFAPQFSKQSPGKMMMHLLTDLAAADGVTTLDMTPGSGWKDRFATRNDTCAVLRIFFGRRDRLAAGAARSRDAVARAVAVRIGTTPDAVRARLAPLRRLGAVGLAAAALSRVLDAPRLVRSRVDLDLHRMSPEAARAVQVWDAREDRFRVNDLSDLMRFRPAERWQTRQAFLSEALDRMGRGDRVYTRVEDGVLAACAWLAPEQTRSVIPEVREEVVLPAGSAVAYDFWTHLQWRGRGLHERALRQVVRDAGDLPGCTGVWMGVRADNAPARRNVEKLGWPVHCRLSMDVVLGRVQPRTGRKALHAQPTWISSLVQGAKRALLHAAKRTGAFAAARVVTRNELRILCYHGWELTHESAFAPRLFMKGSTFGARLDHLVENRYRVIPLEQAVDGLADGRLPRLPVVITIDDGAASTALVAAKELTERRLPSTLYVTTYHVEKPGPVFRTALRYLFWRTQSESLDLSGVGPFEKDAGAILTAGEGAMECAYRTLVRHAETELDEPGRQALGRVVATRLGLDWDEMTESRRCSLTTPDELRALAEQGIDLQLHTHRHRFPADEQLVRREIEENRAALGKVLPVRFEHLCYPDNQYDPVQFPWLADLGVRSGTTCDRGLNAYGANPLRLRRLLDGECVRPIEFEAEMSGFNELVRRVIRVLLRRPR